MKAFIIGMIITLSTAMAAQATLTFFDPVGPAKISLTVMSTPNGYETLRSKTNLTATSTNITTVVKSSVSRKHFDSADMLALVANSFNTNFPDGSQIAMGFNGFRVVDGTGTNVIFDPSPVETGGEVDSWLETGRMTEVSTNTPTGSGEADRGNSTTTLVLNMSYDDRALTTADGTFSRFVLRGIFKQISMGDAKGVVRTMFDFQVVSSGVWRNESVIMTGEITAKVPLYVPPPN